MRRRLRRRLRFDWLLARDVRDHAGQVTARDDLEAFNECRLSSVDSGNEESLEAVHAQPLRRYEHAVYVADLAIQGELAEKC